MQTIREHAWIARNHLCLGLYSSGIPDRCLSNLSSRTTSKQQIFPTPLSSLMLSYLPQISFLLWLTTSLCPVRSGWAEQINPFLFAAVLYNNVVTPTSTFPFDHLKLNSPISVFPHSWYVLGPRSLLFSELSPCSLFFLKCHTQMWIHSLADVLLVLNSYFTFSLCSCLQMARLLFLLYGTKPKKYEIIYFIFLIQCNN